MYTYTDMGALVLNSYPPWPGGMPGCYRWWLRGPGDRGAGDGVLGQRLVGGQVVEEHLRLRDVPLHHRARARVAEPAERHHGRHRLFRANATEASGDRLVPWSTVREDAAPLAAGITANGRSASSCRPR